MPRLLPHANPRLAPFSRIRIRSPQACLARSKLRSLLALSGTTISKENGGGSAKMLFRQSSNRPPELWLRIITESCGRDAESAIMGGILCTLLGGINSVAAHHSKRRLQQE